MIQAVCFFLLFLAPFIIAPFGITAFENPKVIAAEAGIILLLLISIFTNKLRLNRRQLIIYGLIIVLTFIHLIFLRTELSFFGNAFRMQGIFLLWMLLLFSYLVSGMRFRKIPGWVFAALLIIETIVIFFLPLNESQRFVGTLGEPNALATSAIFTWPFGWFAIKNGEKLQILKRALLLVPVTAILYLSGSKSGIIAFGIQLLFLVLLKKKFSIKKAAAICLFGFLISLFFPYFQKNPYENRVEVWRSAIAAGSVSPFVGNGFGNTEIALAKAAKKVDLPIQYYYFDSSHNIFLDWWVQGGLIGLGLIIALTTYSIKQFIVTENKRELVLLLGLLTSLSFNPASVAGLLAFWWLIGRGFDIFRIHKREEQYKFEH